MNRKTLVTITNQLSKPRRKRSTVGHLGELAATLLLEESGYLVRKPEERQTGDLHAIDQRSGELIRVEIKTARRGKDRKWRFTLYKQSDTSSTDHRNSDIVVLLAVTVSGALVPFVIPVSVVADQSQVAITSDPRTYSGRMAQYRQRLGSLTLSLGSVQ